MAFKISEPYKEIELGRFGGLYTEADARGLPTGSSPLNHDVDFLVGLVGIRPGLRSAAYLGPGYSAYAAAASAGPDWLNPQNGIGPPDGRYAQTTPGGAGQQTEPALITQGQKQPTAPIVVGKVSGTSGPGSSITLPIPNGILLPGDVIFLNFSAISKSAAGMSGLGAITDNYNNNYNIMPGGFISIGANLSSAWEMVNSVNIKNVGPGFAVTLNLFQPANPWDSVWVTGLILRFAQAYDPPSGHLITFQRVFDTPYPPTAGVVTTNTQVTAGVFSVPSDPTQLLISSAASQVGGIGVADNFTNQVDTGLVNGGECAIAILNPPNVGGYTSSWNSPFIPYDLLGGVPQIVTNAIALYAYTLLLPSGPPLTLTEVAVPATPFSIPAPLSSGVRPGGSGGAAPTGQWQPVAAQKASVVVNPNTSSKFMLVASNLGFSIPESATILGLEINFNGTTTLLPANIAGIFGSFAGGVFTEASEWEQVPIPSLAIASPLFLGGSGDLWGGTWTPDEINSPNFAIGLVAQAGLSSASPTITVDTVTVTIFYGTVISSSPLLLTQYNFNAPANVAVTGIEAVITGYATGTAVQPVTVQLVYNGVPLGNSKPLSLSGVPAPIQLGTLADTWSVNNLAQYIGKPGFGLSLTALQGGTYFIDAAQLILTVGPSGTPFFGWIKSAALTGGLRLTLALDGNGTLWQENLDTTPGQFTSFYNSILPNSYCLSETIAGREFACFFDSTRSASDQPRAWDGMNLDRISQVGPGIGPTVIVDNAAYNIAASPLGLVFPFPQVAIAFWEWGAAPSEGSSGKPGTTITIYGTTNGPASFINAVNVGDNIYITGLPNTVSGVSPDGTFPVIAAGKFIRGSGAWNYYISVVGPSTQFNSVRVAAAATYQKTLALVTLINPIPLGLVQVGSVLTIAGAAPVGWNASYPIVATPTQGQLLITSTVLSGDIATYTYVVVSGASPGWQANELVTIGQQLVSPAGDLWQVTAITTGLTGGTLPPFTASPQTDGGVTWTKQVGSMLVTVFNTNNGNGIFNVSAVGIASATPTQFTVPINAPDIPAAAEQGAALNGQGTIFEIDPGINTLGTANNPILASGGGGTVVIAGTVAPGVRYAMTMFLTRNGLLTPGSPPTQFFTTSGTNGIRFANLALGPSNIVARVVGITPAGAGIGGPYFYISSAVVVPNLIQGGSTTFQSTVIPDNISNESNLINFSDAVLLTGIEVTVQGQNNLQQRELGAAVKVVLYASRAFYLGEQTKEDTFINTTFDGGYSSSSPNIPAGWKVDSALGAISLLRSSPIFGFSVYMLNTTGAVFNPSNAPPPLTFNQTAYLNVFLSPIVLPNTAYSIRATVRSLTGAASGNLVFSLFSASMGEWKFSIPLANLTKNFQVFSGPLNNPLWNTVPADLQLRFYPQDMPNNTDIEIERFDPFFTAQPVYTTQLAASYDEDFEAIDGVTGKVDTSGETAQTQTNAFEWNDSLYITTGGRTMISVDNDSTEPSGWKVRTISEDCGCFGPDAADVGEQYVIQAEPRGAFIFDGGNHTKISQEIQQVWNLIYKPAYKSVWVRNDLIQRRLLFGIPMVTPNVYLPNAPVNNNPTTPNVILMCSYLGLDTAKEIAAAMPIHVSMFTGNLLARDMVRKWTIWQIPSPYAAFISRPSTQQQFWLGGTVGAGKMYVLDPTATDDDGNVIDEDYYTFDFSDPATNQGLGLGNVRKLYPYMSILIEGGGSYVLTAYPETIFAPAPYPIVAPPKILRNPALSDPNVPLNITGNRVFLRFRVDGNLGSNYLLKSIVLAVIRDTKIPVSGIDTTGIGGT